MQLNIGNAPPPPVVIYQAAPQMMVVPHSAVYVLDDDDRDYDFFRYGVYWFIWNKGYWYRSSSYRGPFRVIEARYVPDAIWNVPSRRWKHHPHGMPPGQARKEAVTSEGRSNVRCEAGRAACHSRSMPTRAARPASSTRAAAA